MQLQIATVKLTVFKRETDGRLPDKGTLVTEHTGYVQLSLCNMRWPRDTSMYTVSVVQPGGPTDDEGDECRSLQVSLRPVIRNETDFLMLFHGSPVRILLVGYTDEVRVSNGKRLPLGETPYLPPNNLSLIDLFCMVEISDWREIEDPDSVGPSELSPAIREKQSVTLVRERAKYGEKRNE